MLRILIVDDEPLMRQALREIIFRYKQAAFKFYESENGYEAVKLCENHPMDLVFMDIMMPVMNGLEAAEVIASMDKKTTLYFVSSYQNFKLAENAIRLKVKEYITKPVSPKAIHNLLNRYMKENNKYPDGIIERVYELVQMKDFEKIYASIPEITEEIKMLPSGNNRESAKIFYEIGEKLLLFFCSDEEVRNIRREFPIDERMILENRLYSVWMFQIIHHIYLYRSINHYPILKDVFSYIDTHILDNISLKDIVTDCAVSQGYLSRIFKKEFNTTVMRYLHLRKMNLAKPYIAFEEISLNEVCFKLGYNEISYFCKVFKKYENMTVEQFKEKNT